MGRLYAESLRLGPSGSVSLWTCQNLARLLRNRTKWWRGKLFKNEARSERTSLREDYWVGPPRRDAPAFL